MAKPIVPGPVADRIYCQTAAALSPDLANAASVRTAVDPQRDGITQPLEQQTRPPLRRCSDCRLDLGRDVLRALCAPHWGKRRLGVESHCPAFIAKGGAQ